jgi:hypothetical protein
MRHGGMNGREGIGVLGPLRIEYPGAFYDVTSRGNERRMVFQSNQDREKYLCYFELKDHINHSY